MPKFTIAAPAKVNLHLAVKDRRPDGFHNLESVFLAVNFGDTLHFEPISDINSVEITMEGVNIDIPAEKNIIFRAVTLFRSKTGYDQGLKIRVEKRIPPGGGLGGGSSNAASTLLALNSLAGSELSREALLEMAASLGSDVPFFIHQTPAAWVTGRGERIEPIEAPRCFLVLVNPGFPSGTAAAFRLLDLFRNSSRKDASNLRFAAQRRKEGRGEDNEMLSFNDSVPLCLREGSFGINSFLDVFKEPEKSAYDKIISQLREHGAYHAGLSGAGSTCFGVFAEKAQAEKTAAAMRETWDFAECTYPNYRDTNKNEGGIF